MEEKLHCYECAEVLDAGYHISRIYKTVIPCKKCAAEHSVHLTALRRGLVMSILVNVILLAVVLATIGGR